MSVTKEQVLATAALCRINLSQSPSGTPGEGGEDSVAEIAAQLDAVLGYMDILNQVDTDKVEPLYCPLEHVAPPRKDAAEKRRSADEILANAPERQQSFFVVPPVI